MPETRAHRRAKKRVAGPGGRTEVPLRGAQRLDALTKGGGRTTEVERSGSASELNAAAQRLKKSRAPQEVLEVPQKDMGTVGRSTRSALTRRGPVSAWRIWRGGGAARGPATGAGRGDRNDDRGASNGRADRRDRFRCGTAKRRQRDSGAASNLKNLHSV